MNKCLLRWVVLLVLCCFVVSTQARQRVAEFQGSGDKTTAEFEVTAPWILDWLVASEFQRSLGLQVNLIDARSGEFLGKAVATKWISNGVRLFNTSGRFRFEVDATFANWRLRVEQLSRAEAETFKPKNP